MRTMNLWIIGLGLMFCVTSSAFGQQATPSLEELIAGIKKSEALYTNLQLKWEQTFELVNPVPARDHQTKRIFTTGTHAANGEKLRWDCHAEFVQIAVRNVNGVLLNERVSEDSKFYFDGKQTMSMSNRSDRENSAGYVLISPGYYQYDASRLARPHGTLLSFDRHADGLSYWLNQWKQDPNFSITLEGFEIRNNEPCLKVVVREFHPEALPDREPSRVKTSRKLWLAINRHDLDIAMEVYEHDVSLTVPAITAEVYAFREFTPGVFTPQLIITEFSDREIARQEHRRLVDSQVTYKLIECQFDPEFPDDYFSGFPIPDGAIVTVLNDKQETKRKYIQGAKEE